MFFTRSAGLAAALLIGAAFAAPATAAVSVVTSPANGTFAPINPVAPGVYGAELRRGNNAGNGDWEIGVGTQTSNAGTFTQNQFAWNANTVNFSANWTATTLTVIVGNVTTTHAVPLLGDTLRIAAKRDATATITNVDGAAFNQSVSGSLVAPTMNELLFHSTDNWGGNGLTIAGTARIGSLGGSGSASEIFFTLGDFTAVPEPATWAMMIGGFGLVGAAMRRRRSTTLVTA